MRICAGGLLMRGGEILLAKRSEDRTFYPGVWDVIGGHCEGNETPADALLRELAEEIGVRALVFEEIAVLREPQPAEQGEARYHMCIVTAWSGEPRLRNAEHSALRWLDLNQALALPLAHPSYSGLFQTALGRASVRNRDLSLRHAPDWHSARASCQQVMPNVRRLLSHS
jgi:8-oxo-dGTP diphosphatase